MRLPFGSLGGSQSSLAVVAVTRETERSLGELGTEGDPEPGSREAGDPSRSRQRRERDSITTVLSPTD